MNLGCGFGAHLDGDTCEESSFCKCFLNYKVLFKFYHFQSFPTNPHPIPDSGLTFSFLSLSFSLLLSPHLLRQINHFVSLILLLSLAGGEEEVNEEKGECAGVRP